MHNQVMQLRHLLFAVLAASCATTKQPPVEAPHRGFPPSCVNRPALQLVKLATPATAAELAWARDFGAAYGLSISWDEPIALPPAVTTASGAQQVAEDLVAALDARKAKPPRTTIVVGLTDQDLFIRGKTDWRWAFGLYEQQTVVISTARMEPGDARFSGRLSKHLARVLGTIVCGLPRTGPPRSELRREVGGLDDLDEIEEFNWELEEKPQALDRDAVRAQLLQIDELIKSKQPKQAIAVAEKIIAQYEAALAPRDVVEHAGAALRDCPSGGDRHRRPSDGHPVGDEHATATPPSARDGRVTRKRARAS